MGPLLDGRMKGEFLSLAKNFNDGDITFEKCVKSIKLHSKSKDQFCFKTEKSIELLNESLRRKEIIKKEDSKMRVIETKYFNKGK